MSASTSGFDPLRSLVRNRLGRPGSADASFGAGVLDLIVACVDGDGDGEAETGPLACVSAGMSQRL